MTQAELTYWERVPRELRDISNELKELVAAIKESNELQRQLIESMDKTI